jgi:hypothetical protein
MPAKRGRAGGLARAHQASRLGERRQRRFMAHEDWEQSKREIAERKHMRYAAASFTRVAKAARLADGTFALSE